MSFFNKYLSNIKPYQVASHQIWQVSVDERKDILKLDWNESTINPSPNVKKRLNELMKTDFLNLYPATYNEELHNLLSKYTGLPRQNIQYFASSDSLHEYISKVYISPEDTILIVWPSYDNFRLTVEVAGATVRFFEVGDDFKLQKEVFEDYLTNHAPTLVYICNPNNPTGQVIDKEYIQELLIKYPSILFLIDEAYIEFSPNNSCKELVRTNNNILISRTMSKAFGLANVRFGYLLASEENIDFVSKIRNPKNITTFTQEAVIGALEDIGYMEDYVNQVNLSKQKFIKKINDLPKNIFDAYDSEANFVMIMCKSLTIKQQLIEYLRNNSVFVRDVYHSPKVEKCIRITIGNDKQMSRVISLFEKFVDSEEI